MTDCLDCDRRRREIQRLETQVRELTEELRLEKKWKRGYGE